MFVGDSALDPPLAAGLGNLLVIIVDDPGGHQPVLGPAFGRVDSLGGLGVAVLVIAEVDGGGGQGAGGIHQAVGEDARAAVPEMVIPVVGIVNVVDDLVEVDRMGVGVAADRPRLALRPLLQGRIDLEPPAVLRGRNVIGPAAPHPP